MARKRAPRRRKESLDERASMVVELRAEWAVVGRGARGKMRFGGRRLEEGNTRIWGSDFPLLTRSRDRRQQEAFCRRI